MTTFALFGAIVLIAVILAIIVFYPAMRDDNIRDRRIDEAAWMPPAPKKWSLTDAELRENQRRARERADAWQQKRERILKEWK